MFVTARQLESALGWDWAANDHCGGGVMLMLTTAPGENPSAVIVTWPGAVTDGGLTDTPWPMHVVVWALAMGPSLLGQALCARMAKATRTAQIPQSRVIVYSSTLTGAGIAAYRDRAAQPVYKQPLRWRKLSQWERS